MYLQGVLRAGVSWTPWHMSLRTTSLCQRPCDTKGRWVRRHLVNPRDWQQGCQAREKTRKYMSTCSRLVGAVALASEMEGWACARGDMQAHGRVCVGATSFCPQVIHNWRVLWYSMPSINRRELLLKLFAASLQDHRAKGGSNDAWRMQFTIFGQPVAGMLCSC